MSKKYIAFCCVIIAVIVGIKSYTLYLTKVTNLAMVKTGNKLQRDPSKRQSDSLSIEDIFSYEQCIQDPEFQMMLVEQAEEANREMYLYIGVGVLTMCGFIFYGYLTKENDDVE